jgi:hypothetical protein
LGSWAERQFARSAKLLVRARACNVSDSQCLSREEDENDDVEAESFHCKPNKRRTLLR